MTLISTVISQLGIIQMSDSFARLGAPVRRTLGAPTGAHWGRTLWATCPSEHRRFWRGCLSGLAR